MDTLQRTTFDADVAAAVQAWMSDNRTGLDYELVAPTDDLAFGLRLGRANLPPRLADGTPAPGVVLGVGVTDQHAARPHDLVWVGLRLADGATSDADACAAYRARLVVLHPFFKGWDEASAPWVARKQVEGRPDDAAYPTRVANALTTLVYALTIHLPRDEGSTGA